MALLTFLSLILLIPILLVTLFNVLTAPTLHKAPCPKQQVRVSVLVPARNEERNIALCLDGLLAQSYQDYEVLVLDDCSEDGTQAIVHSFLDRHQRLKLLRGKPLPEGWTGKNWACHQLSQEATGEILIFTDADNRHSSEAIGHTVGWIQKLGLGLFSAFPQQITRSLSEQLVIPVVDMLVYSALPLWFTYRFRSPAFAAANGQWLAMTRAAYERIGGHAAARQQIVEDVELSRCAKKLGVPILTSAGTNVVSGRMYRSIGEVWQGFSKNLFGLTGHKTLPFFLIVVGLSLACVWPYVAVWHTPTTQWSAIAIVVNLLIRGTLVIKYRHPVFVSVLLHPVGIALTLLIASNSYVQIRSGQVRWKGRTIHTTTRDSVPK